MINITLGFSPCPNDTFIFDALVHKKINTGPYRFTYVLQDVQTLNEMALQGQLQMTKFSYGVWPAIAGRYLLLQAGSALGKGVGPLLIARPGKESALPENSRVLVPGLHTTAHLLYRFRYPQAPAARFVLFHEIEPLLLAGEADLGVIIHENRFTYAAKGLKLHTDLGAYWESQTSVPVPLGGIALRNDLAPHLPAINALLHQSIQYAWAQHPVLPEFVHAHAQEMSEQVMRQHIHLYVNEFSESLGTAGLQAIDRLTEVYNQQHQSSRVLNASL